MLAVGNASSDASVAADIDACVDDCNNIDTPLLRICECVPSWSTMRLDEMKDALLSVLLQIGRVPLQLDLALGLQLGRDFKEKVVQLQLHQRAVASQEVSDEASASEAKANLLKGLRGAIIRYREKHVSAEKDLTQCVDKCVRLLGSTVPSELKKHDISLGQLIVYVDEMKRISARCEDRRSMMDALLALASLSLAGASDPSNYEQSVKDWLSWKKDVTQRDATPDLEYVMQFAELRYRLGFSNLTSYSTDALTDTAGEVQEVWGHLHDFLMKSSFAQMVHDTHCAPKVVIGMDHFINALSLDKIKPVSAKQLEGKDLHESYQTLVALDARLLFNEVAAAIPLDKLGSATDDCDAADALPHVQRLPIVRTIVSKLALGDVVVNSLQNEGALGFNASDILLLLALYSSVRSTMALAAWVVVALLDAVAGNDGSPTLKSLAEGVRLFSRSVVSAVYQLRDQRVRALDGHTFALRLTMSSLDMWLESMQHLVEQCSNCLIYDIFCAQMQVDSQKLCNLIPNWKPCVSKLTLNATIVKQVIINNPKKKILNQLVQPWLRWSTT
jgi:hypothetical protein